MSVLKFTCEENLKKNFPSGLKQIHITSVTENLDLTGRYIRANIFKRYQLNASKVPSVKFLLQEDVGSIICLHGFGDIAALLDSCTLGDTLFLLEYDVEIAPKQSRYSTKFQLILDERNHVKPIAWVLKRNLSLQDTNSGSTSTLTQRKTQTQKQSYVYTTLNELKANSKVNVYGLVTHVRKLAQTSGNDKLLTINITDQSMKNRASIVTCNLFHCDSDELPTEVQAGDVIRFHRLKIKHFEDKLQGTNGPGFHWLYFQDSYDNIVSSSPNYTLERQDQEKVQALFEWRESFFSVSKNNDATILDAAEQSLSDDALNCPSTSSSSSTALVPSSSRANDRSPSKSSLKENITYELLRDVQFGTTVNVFGIVIYVKSPITTKCSQYHMMINITDQSLRNKDDKLTCNLFNAEQDKLPFTAEIGDVIRIRRLKIQQYNGKKQGCGIVSWALFRGSCERPVAYSDSFSPNSQEKSKVADLWKWWQEGPEPIPLSQCVARQYFNLVCQIIGVYLEESKSCRILLVWDGTAFQGSILNRTDIEMKTDEALLTAAGNLATDIFLFDNHADDSAHIQPGDVIKVTNLHANVVSGCVEMTLHGGTNYNKGVTVLDKDRPESKRLLEVLKPFLTHKAVGSTKDRGEKRHKEDVPKNDEPSPRKKFCKERDKDSQGYPSRSYYDSQDYNNSYVERVESAIAKEYDNVPQDADPSQRDRIAIEAYLNKKNNEDEESQRTKSGESGKDRSSDQDKKRSSVDENPSCKKKSVKEGDQERVSESSSEASPSIWLSLYNSPTSIDELEIFSSKSGMQCHSGRQYQDLRIKRQHLKCSDPFDPLEPSTSGRALSRELRRDEEKANQTSQVIPIKSISTDDSRKSSAKGRDKNKNEDYVSSQDSFFTAAESISPHRDSKSQLKQQQPISTSSQSSLKQLSLKQTKTQHSPEFAADSSGIQENDEEISSSLDCQLKRNVDEFFDSQISSSTESKNSELSKDSNNDDEPLQCMLKTATAILNHPNVKRSKLKEVLHHEVPHKFKILVRMLDYHPKPARAENLVSFCCLDCKYMISASAVSDSLDSERICPNCIDNGTLLTPAIIMKFLLSDGKYDLICHLWKSHAVEFFQGIQPQALLSNKDCMMEVQQYLDRLCPPDTDFKDKPFMECCIFSYSVNGDVFYQMFDTVVV